MEEPRNHQSAKQDGDRLANRGVSLTSNPPGEKRHAAEHHHQGLQWLEEDDTHASTAELVTGQESHAVTKGPSMPTALFAVGLPGDSQSKWLDVQNTSISKRIPSTPKASARALRDSETRYHRLFETAQDGILILDETTGLITDVNPFLVIC
jgi:PAS domain-containing protein